MNADESEIRRAAATIAQADGLLIAAGAGMGIDSGLPDFRGNEGFWRAYPALGRTQLDFYEMASPASFRARPDLAWGFYGHRLDLYRRTQPHRGFELLRNWSAEKARGSFVFTSNVDGQFQKAGFAAGRVYECHGSIHHLQCLDACCAQTWPATAFVPDVDSERCELRNAPPLCPYCGALARPNILMFGDGEWLAQRSEQQAGELEVWLAGVQRPAIIELGAGTAVPSVRYFAERSASRFGVPLIRINPREPEAPRAVDIALPVAALAALDAIGAQLAMPAA